MATSGASVESVRKYILLGALVVMGLGCGFGALVTPNELYVHPAIIGLLWGLAGVHLVLAALLLTERIRPLWVAVYTLTSLTVLVVARANSFFLLMPEAPQTLSVMLPIYAFFPLGLLMAAMCLPPRLSLQINIAAWLSIALSVSYHLISLPPDSVIKGVGPLVLLLWLGYPAFVGLSSSFSISMHRLLVDNARAARASQQTSAEAQRNSAELLALLDNATIGIAMVDVHGGWRRINQRICEITGYRPAELYRLDPKMLWHSDDKAVDEHLLVQVIDHHINQYNVEKRLRRKDGSTLWVSLSVARIDGACPEDDCLVCVVTDINREHEARAELAALNRNLEAVVTERTRDLRATNHLLTGLSEFVAVLQTARSLDDLSSILSGFLPGLMACDSGALLIAEGRSNENLRTLARWGQMPDFAAGLLDCWSLRTGYRHSTDGAKQHMICRHARHDEHETEHVCQPMIANGEVIGVLCLARIGEQERVIPKLQVRTVLGAVSDYIATTLMNLKLAEELRDNAMRDSLTGLLNRRSLREQMQRAISGCRRNALGLSLLLIDIDHFKRFNDNFGHDLGDMVLREVARTLQQACRASDLAFRLGGEEFLLMMPGTDLDGALTAADKIHGVVGKMPIIYRGETVPKVTVSIGVSAFPDHGDDFDLLLSYADKALYQAKDAGRDCTRQAQLGTLVPTAVDEQRDSHRW